jgi:hypothetical protein
MLDQLTDYAISNIWCSPYQDLQAIIQLRRATPVGGRRSYFEYGRQQYYLPDSTHSYHIYSLGQTAPNRLNLAATQRSWVSCAQVMEARNLVIDLYLENGLMFPKTESFLLRTPDKTYLLAVRIQPKIGNLDTQLLYMRFYSSAYFQSSNKPTDLPPIEVKGGTILSSAQGLTLQQQYHLARERVGYVTAYKNGRVVSDFIPGSYVNGDVIEWVYDPTVAEVIDFPLESLQSFISTVDSQAKYLLHPPKKENDYIQYKDDVEIFLLNTAGSVETGVYYHRNIDRSMRMVTHNDYSIPVSHIDNIKIANGWNSEPDVTVRLLIRHTLNNRPLVDEHQRIQDLYEMTDSQIQAALIGIDSTIVEWRAANLENSTYCALMSAVHPETYRSQTPALFGYNAMTKILGKPYGTKTDGYFQLASLYTGTSTVFEYNASGLLLGYRTVVGVENYVPLFPACEYIEVFDGEGGLALDLTYSTTEKFLNPNVGYRFYICDLQNGEPTNAWVDVTGDTSVYTIGTDGRVNWLFNPVYKRGLVKGDSKFTCYSLSLNNTELVWEFTLLDTAPGNELTVLPAKLDIWLNGHPLVETVDFFVRGKKVVVVNRDYLSQTLSQQLVVRGTGFCKDDMTRETPSELGFVEHETISVGSTYNLRNDRAIRCVVGGRFYTPDQLSFAENMREVTVPGLQNGQPYCIDAVLVPLRGLTPYNTYPFRPESLDLDQRVSDYLTAKIPPPEWEGPSPITGLYKVVSPFMAKILSLLERGLLTAPASSATGQEIEQLVTPYKYLLDFDPCVEGYNEEYVLPVPHPRLTLMEVSAVEYAFLERLNTTYLRGVLDLTPSVVIV